MLHSIHHTPKIPFPFYIIVSSSFVLSQSCCNFPLQRHQHRKVRALHSRINHLRRLLVVCMRRQIPLFEHIKPRFRLLHQPLLPPLAYAGPRTTDLDFLSLHSNLLSLDMSLQNFRNLFLWTKYNFCIHTKKMINRLTFTCKSLIYSK